MPPLAAPPFGRPVGRRRRACVALAHSLPGLKRLRELLAAAAAVLAALAYLISTPQATTSLRLLDPLSLPALFGLRRGCPKERASPVRVKKSPRTVQAVEGVSIKRGILTTENSLPPEETKRDLRGHRFYPVASELTNVPRLYKTDGQKPAETVLHLHYFVGPCDWWLAEYDSETRIGFGYACLGDPQSAEWGYVSLEELEGINLGFLVVERDLHWKPREAGKARLPGRGVRL